MRREQTPDDERWVRDDDERWVRDDDERWVRDDDERWVRDDDDASQHIRILPLVSKETCYCQKRPITVKRDLLVSKETC